MALTCWPKSKDNRWNIKLRAMLTKKKSLDMLFKEANFQNLENWEDPIQFGSLLSGHYGPAVIARWDVLRSILSIYEKDKAKQLDTRIWHALDGRGALTLVKLAAMKSSEVGEVTKEKSKKAALSL